VRARVVDIRKLIDDVDRTKSDYETKLEAARKVLEDFEYRGPLQGPYSCPAANVTNESLQNILPITELVR
jgi:hypothetical protein